MRWAAAGHDVTVVTCAPNCPDGVVFDGYRNRLRRQVETVDGVRVMRVWTYVGALIALASLAYAAFLVARTMISGNEVPGYTSTIVAVLFLGGLNLLSLGIMGEYVGRIANEVRRRPLFVVDRVEGF